MLPAGYMAKRIGTKPDWPALEHVSRIYSVSGCISDDFADYIKFWKHNGYWMFDSPGVITDLARNHGIDLSGTMLFYYEVYELQFDAGKWTPFGPDLSLPTEVRVPEDRVLEGYDVVTFWARASPECSPLSCNGLASRIETNEYCLLKSFEQAHTLLEDGTFDNAEPGPYRIFGVYSVDWPRTS